MQNKGKNGQTLKLQSYKVDNQVLASKINELNDLKSELQNTLNKHRNQQSSIIDQLDQLRAQNEKLRAIVSDLQFTKKSQAYLIQQLEKRLETLQTNLSKSKLQLEKEQKDKNELVNYYQKKIVMLEQQAKNNFKVTNYEVSNVKEYRNPHQPPFRMENQTISSIDASSKYDSNKKIKKLKKPSIQAEPFHRASVQIADKYRSTNTILEKQDETQQSGQEIYLQMIRFLFKQLLKIELRARDLIKIPQIQAFNNLRNPSKNDLAKLFSSYPFHIRQNHKVDLIFQFILKESERKGKPLNGKFIIDHIIVGIEQIDGSQSLKQEGEMFSSMVDYKPNNPKIQSQKINRTSYNEQYQGYSNKMSIESALQMSSDTSSY